ncbi:hypothetical protein AOR13_3742 [Alteromonas stellipolaris LMG 21856]|nr:hypothetical protein AOR13_3742 [Alteromonas stellipolaris LMG 21856]
MAHSTDTVSFVQCKLTPFTLIYRIFYNFSGIIKEDVNILQIIDCKYWRYL